MKSNITVSTESNIMKVVYFTFLIPYGLNSLIRNNLNFKDENNYYRGRVCLLQRSVETKHNIRVVENFTVLLHRPTLVL